MLLSWTCALEWCDLKCFPVLGSHVKRVTEKPHILKAERWATWKPFRVSRLSKGPSGVILQAGSGSPLCLKQAVVEISSSFRWKNCPSTWVHAKQCLARVLARREILHWVVAVELHEHNPRGIVEAGYGLCGLSKCSPLCHPGLCHYLPAG